MMRRGLLISALLLLGGTASAQPAMPGPSMGGATAVIQQQLAGSVHRTLSCMSCHGHEVFHGTPSPAEGSCQVCHQREASEFRGGSHGAAVSRGDPQTPTCVSCHGSHGVKPARYSAAPTSPAQAPSSCGRCHRQAADEFIASIHGRALADSQSTLAPSCATCHGAHKAAPVRRQQVAESCGTCHVEAQLAFQRSIHGRAVMRGVLHAPTCTGCHGVHTIQAAAEPTSPTARLQVAGETCARCHGSLRITEMHDLPMQVVKDFQGSFHGLAGVLGDRRMANCASCHGYHEIRPSSSPFSRTNPANLGRTCGECHPGAGDRFARGGVHHIPTTFGHRLVDWVGSMYAGMIVAVIGFMTIHNGVDFQRRWRDRRRPEQPSEATPQPEFLRFTVNERMQHWVLAASFFTLALSGFALRFGWRLPWVDGGLQQTTRAMIHRSAAVLFIALAVYHVEYLVLTARGRAMARAILPRLRGAADLLCCGGACYRIGPPSLADWRELLATLKYNLGLTRDRPAYGRFTYWEKMEYWALAWGTVVMATTGLVLWFETPFLNRFPYWALELLRMVHLYEATLAVLAIVVWHFYYVIVNPDVFPLNRAMTRGTLTDEEMKREHPLDLDSAARRRTDETVEDSDGDRTDQRNADDRTPGTDRGVDPSAGHPPTGGEAPGRQTDSRGGPPQADGGHQGP